MPISEESRRKMGWRKGRLFTAYWKSCEVCGARFKTVPSSSKQHTCSSKCMGIKKRFERKIYKCTLCGKDMTEIKTSGRKYCNNRCKINALAILKKQRSANKRIFGRWRNRRTLKAYLLDKYKACQLCGWNSKIEVLELHHIDRNKKNNKEYNLLLLCPNCHSINHYEALDGQYKINLGVHLHAVQVGEAKRVVMA